MNKSSMRAWIVGVATILVFSFIIIESPKFQKCIEEINDSNPNQAAEKDPSGLPVIVCSRCFVRTIYESEGIITALASIILAIFTYRLWWSTDKLASITSDLHNIASTQEETSRRHERAYIVCGGLFGHSPNGPFPDWHPDAHDATHYTPPWRMRIHNFGRTPGFITKIEWGVMSDTEFPRQRSVSSIIKDRKFTGKLKTPIEIREIVPPTGITPIRFRYLDYGDRITDTVFFGKIHYDDVFGGRHHSTFALLHRQKNTDTIGRSYSEDWS